MIITSYSNICKQDDTIEKSNSGNYACLYALREDCLILNEEWWDYVKTRYTKICNSSERFFVTRYFRR